MKRLVYTLMSVSLLLFFTGCGPSRSVSRVDSNTTIDLSGRWNDADSRQVAGTVTKDFLGAKWLPIYQNANNNIRPVVIVGTVMNKSHEHIDPETFVKDLERAIVNDGRVRLVQGGAKRSELRDEREQHNQGFVSPETAKRWGRELGADFMIQGTINSIVDSYKKDKVVYYQIDMELTNLETNEVVWIGSEKIKKTVSDR